MGVQAQLCHSNATPAARIQILLSSFAFTLFHTFVLWWTGGVNKIAGTLFGFSAKVNSERRTKPCNMNENDVNALELKSMKLNAKNRG